MGKLVATDELKTITVPNMNMELLKEQRDAVLREVEGNYVLAGQDGTSEQINLLDGLINLLDYMLDLGKGYK
jgi:DNA helicase HerA-like ATPase